MIMNTNSKVDHTLKLFLGCDLEEHKNYKRDKSRYWLLVFSLVVFVEGEGEEKREDRER